MLTEQKKLVLPVIEEGIDPGRLGVLQGLVRVTFDRKDPVRPIQAIADALMRHATLQQQQLLRGVGILAAIIGGLWLFGGEG